METRSVKIFWREGCPQCPGAKELGRQLQEEGMKVEYFNVETVEGLAEASFYSVLSTPSIIVTDGGGREIISWRGKVPFYQEIKEVGAV